MAKMYPNGYPYYGIKFMGLSEGDRVATLADNIKLLREEHGLSQKAFGEKVQAYAATKGFSFGGKNVRTLISKYENKTCSPKLDILVMICEAFNVSLIWLCGYKPAQQMRMPRIFKIQPGIRVSVAKTAA